MEIKRIIFDIDNTLIEWKEEYWKTLENTFKELNLQYSDEDIFKIKYAMNSYEYEIGTTYNKKIMQAEIEKSLGYALPPEFMDVLLKYLGECVPEKIDEATLETLEYLKNKYNLVILSNWFASSQIARLKKTGLYQFFSQTYMPETFRMKPNKEAFEKASGEYKISECIMVGDNLKIDIEGAINAGMKAIYITKTNKSIDIEKGNNNIIATINKISELKQIL